MPTVRHTEEVGNLRRFLCLMRNVDFFSKYLGLFLFSFKDRFDAFYLLEDVDAWWCEPKAEEQK